MRSPKELEEFFDTYLPRMKAVIEELWLEDRADVQDFLRECYSHGFVESWMQPYFYDMYSYACHSDHKYTNPWSVL